MSKTEYEGHMKASELSGTQYVKALIYGESGAGKTCLAAQFDGPVEVWDFDNKFGSAVNFMRSNGQAEALSNIDVYQFGQLPLKERIPAFEARMKLIDDAQLKKQPLHFKTVILDSITTLTHHLMEDYIHRSQLGIKRPLPGINALQDYMLYDKHMTRILVGLLGLNVNVICLAHIETEKDEGTGEIHRRPLAAGQQLAKKLPVWFEEVYIAKLKSDGKRVLQTAPGGGFTIARTQRGLASEIPMTIQAILNSK